MLVTALQYDTFLGKYAIGRIHRGVAQRGQALTLIKTDGTTTNAKIDKLFISRGLAKEEVSEAGAGDIVYIVGAAEAHIGETLASRDQPEALPVMAVEAPTISMYLGTEY